MSYKKSKITGKIYTSNNIEVIQDDTNQDYLDYVEWLSQDNEIVLFEGTPEEIAEQQANELKAKETEMYKKRTQDGINAYAEISAEFRLAKLSGTITEEAHAHIERMLIPVRNEVLAGQWISGLKELELIGSEAVGQQLYDRLHLQISNYIAENY